MKKGEWRIGRIVWGKTSTEGGIMSRMEIVEGMGEFGQHWTVLTKGGYSWLVHRESDHHLTDGCPVGWLDSSFINKALRREKGRKMRYKRKLKVKMGMEGKRTSPPFYGNIFSIGIVCAAAAISLVSRG